MTFEHCWHLNTEQETAALAQEFSLFVAAGDWIGLTGDLGAGKTTFARALIRAMSNAPIDVPSPTFTLVQLYDETRVPVAHLDLYRLEDVAEADELGLDELAVNHVVLVEWSDRLGDRLPADRLTIELKIAGKSRTAKVTGHGRWQMRLERLVEAGKFLAAEASGDERQFLQGDASARRYERLIGPGGTSRLLMDMPSKSEPRPADGSPGYSQLVHLAEDIRAVVAVNRELCTAGYSAPEIIAADLDQGFAIIEDLGDAAFGNIENYGAEVSEPIKAAVDVLADMAERTWPDKVAVDGITHTVEAFDAVALMAEADLLMDWFWPLVHGTAPDDDLKSEYASLWRPLLEAVQADQPVWVMRDYHSPNLIWLPEREGLRRVGIIDTQDAVMGSAAYDVASLLQDARLDVDAAVEAELLDHYVQCRQRADRAFNNAEFRASYAVLGAQRAAKVLGIFARLSKRDGKPGYLRHIPRVSALLERNLGQPGLAKLKAWFDQNLPPDLRGRQHGNVA